MEKVKKMLSSILILIILFVGLSFSFWLGQRKASPVIQIEPEKSKLIEKRYFNITGIVTEINLENRILTLSADGETIEIPIKEDTLINRFVFKEEIDQGDSEPEIITFRDIKIGDEASLFTEEKEDGKLEGTNMFIISTPSQE